VRVPDSGDQSFSFGGVKNVGLTNVVQTCPLFALGVSPPPFEPVSTSRIGKLRGMDSSPADHVHPINCSMFAICEQLQNRLFGYLFGRLRKHLRDHFLQWRVFDADVFKRVICEHGREDLRNLMAIDA
jgi:hypothetical protein